MGCGDGAKRVSDSHAGAEATVEGTTQVGEKVQLSLTLILPRSAKVWCSGC